TDWRERQIRAGTSRGGHTASNRVDVDPRRRIPWTGTFRRLLVCAARAGLLWTAIRNKTQWSSIVLIAGRRARKRPGASGASIGSQTVFCKTCKAKEHSV